MMKSTTVFHGCAVALACSVLAGCFPKSGGSPSRADNVAKPDGAKIDGMAGPWLSERKGIVIYPDNVANPRGRTVPADPDGAKGNGMGIWATFTYPLAPLVGFEQGGSATFFLRDNSRRLEKTVLSLEDGGTSLAVIVAPASEGKTLKLRWSVDQKAVVTVDSGVTAAEAWVPCSLRWTATKAVLEQDGKSVAAVKIDAPFDPKRLSLNVYHVDELAVDGNGSFRLDWDLEPGYAAAGEAKSPSEVAVAQLHGFDAMVVSQERTPRRDRPFVQVCNTSATERKTVFHFSLASELRNHANTWTQAVTVPPRSSVEQLIDFPLVLDTDVYHLTTTVDGAELAERDSLRNFMAVERRNEPAGPPKFGFHTFGVTTLGSWPDALPAHWRHMYSNWGYVVGPMWLKDWDGNFGMNPDTPPEQWNWEPRIDWAIQEGRKTIVSASSVPYFPWMREKDYDASYMNKTYPWGKAGGDPNLVRYRQYIHALAEHYQGKVDIYELDNEPNTISYSGKPAVNYGEVMKVAGEEIHAVDPRAKVFGISGTSQFVNYIRDAFATGAAKSVDGVSWHTYTTPMLPIESGLPQMLRRARETIDATGCKLPVTNTETGVYTACREVYDQPIARERLAELIKQGIQPLQVPSGWPSYALDEWTAAASMIQNITCNLAAGVQQFIFFGWDPKMEKETSWWNVPGEGCFQIFGRVKDGTMTPSLFTLACAVAMVQMEGVLTEKGASIDQEGVVGAVFEKADGGQLAVLWSSGGRRTVMLRTACPEIDTVSLFGADKMMTAKGAGPFLHRIELDDKPIYLHMKKPGMTLSPSPVIGFERTPGNAGERKIKFILVNRFDTKWAGSVGFSSAEGMAIAPAKIDFSLEPGGRQAIETVCTPAMGMAKGIHLVEAAIQLPDGAPFVFPAEIDVRPSFTTGRVPNTFTLKDIRDWKPQGGELAVNRPEQVAVGRPPELTSLQEEQYWKGPDELSASVATGYNDQGFFARITVHDKNRGPLKAWPGVEGSCIEWFFDLRSPAKGLGGTAYDRGVTQIVAKPALADNEKVELWSAGNTPVPFKGVEAIGGAVDQTSYWMGIFVPWTTIDAAAKTPEAIGFDVAVDGPPAGAVGRKSQIILFGGAYSNKDASGFGAGRLVP